MTPPAEPLREWIADVGLELHVQIGTESKLFCRCPVRSGEPPNALTCEICSGQPGSLPRLNGEALRRGLTAALALGCTPAAELRFDRKHDVHPGLPKGYQITQEAVPLATDGALIVDLPDGRQRRVRIARLQLAEDSGRLLHPDDSEDTLVDLNSAGLPLLELVTFPDLHDADDAVAFVQALRQLLRDVGVGACDMRQGQLRCDLNISLRRPQSEQLGTRTETRNLTSFEALGIAFEAETVRQRALLEGGLEVVRQTMGLDSTSERTIALRGKPGRDEYHCFADPDLPVIDLDPAWIAQLASELPETSGARGRRYIADHGLAPQQAAELASERCLAELFEGLCAQGCAPHSAATWLLGELRCLARESACAVDELGLTPERLAALIALVDDDTLSRQAAYELASALRADPQAEPLQLATTLGLLPIGDPALLEPWVEQVLHEQAELCERYRAGNPELLQALVDAVMQASAGRADPKLVQSLLTERLAR